MKTILLIEDEPSLIKILDIVFSVEGFQVIRTQNAEDALQFCLANTPDLIISDINLGGIDGLELLEELRSQENFKQVPAIIISATSNTALIARARALGASAFFSKPFDVEELVQVASSLLALEPKNQTAISLWPPL